MSGGGGTSLQVKKEGRRELVVCWQDTEDSLNHGLRDKSALRHNVKSDDTTAVLKMSLTAPGLQSDLIAGNACGESGFRALEPPSSLFWDGRFSYVDSTTHPQAGQNVVGLCAVCASRNQTSRSIQTIRSRGLRHSISSSSSTHYHRNNGSLQE
ncbi:hypothetical protein RRG08_014372 [Elysia crispata]|uniref:Uncharacterized protein n=1 Tax=Elysia crispata TaxID=231223 RepID=A0AAE1D2B7_9GAST|nr:hypothetical protein RRG08_014372 [Elysia crispata]